MLCRNLSTKCRALDEQTHHHSIPTVCLDATSLVVGSDECDDGRIGPTRCACIDGALGDRWGQSCMCRRPLVGAGSAHSRRTAGSRLASTADLGGVHRPATIPRSATPSCGDASPARCAPGRCSPHGDRSLIQARTSVVYRRYNLCMRPSFSLSLCETPYA